MVRIASLIVSAVLVAAGLGLSATEAQAAVADPPNIVVFYIDDHPVHDGRLYDSASRMPAVQEHFVASGLHFPNAIAQTPQCCPARASLLTGLHSHNHRVMENDARLLNPGEHVGKALQRAGYATMFIGKYLNRNDLLSSSQWAAHEAGWDYMDVIKGVNGAFTNYTLRLKGGSQISYGSYHSTRMVAERAVMRMRQVPANKQFMSILSIYNTHLPNKPMPEFVGSEKCADMPPWNPPNYNEADVSDKPAHVRARQLLPMTDGWPMVKHCEEMLGVDWAVRTVTDELAAQGRLDNTLLVFTADNGNNWGAHRLRHKNDPYATPVPLYMSWPARWGNTPRTIRDHVSNIDLAPTFCAIAGCTMGPYPGGQTGPDGFNLLKLLDGEVDDVGRDAVLEQGIAAANTIRWTALRTTHIHPRGLWHYVEYATGERELYDLENDPWELENLAGQSGRANLIDDLAQRLRQLRREGVVQSPAGPDLFVGLAKTGPFKGKNVYAATPIDAQTQKRTGVVPGQTYKYWMRVQNDASSADRITLGGTTLGTGKMTVAYLVSGTDVTAQIANGTYVTPSLAPGAYITVVVRITVGSNVVAGDVTKVLLRGTSVADPARVDVARAVAKR